MTHPSFKLIPVILMIALVSLACQLTAPAAPTPTPEPAQPVAPAITAAPEEPVQPEAPQPAAPQRTETADQPVRISGTFSYTNDIITTYYSEQMVALVDLYGFVTRNLDWVIPVDSQVLGYLELDTDKKDGSYHLDLPEQPRGTLVDVDQNGQTDSGVQIFAVSYWPNLLGSPYSTGDDESKGWPNYLASVVTDPENQDEVTGGKLVVWAPDADQQFPTGFGADGQLFTADDPVGPIPAGYSIVDLDQDPFTVSQEKEPELTLYEPQDVAVKDFSAQSYSKAFKNMFDQVRREYAFNDIEGKAPDWDTLWADLEPRVADAEQNHDPRAYYLALRDFVLAFKDGHVGLDGGDVITQEIRDEIGGGYGLSLAETDDHKVIVTYLTDQGPAQTAGIKVGAEITQFNATPIQAALDAVQPLTGPFSTEFAKRTEQLRFLVRAPLGTQAEITYVNPKTSGSRTAKLTAISEVDSLNHASADMEPDPNALPVEYRLIQTDTGYLLGYVKINSNYDDLSLILRLFERALKVFEDNQAYGLIVDLRQNYGGADLGLAGFLTQQEIPLGQLEYYSEDTGKFEPEGEPGKLTPYQEQYSFSKEALLVSQACYSACEIEAYAFSQIPGMMVVGYTPTAGVEAEVARGQYQLPDGFSIQIPTGRFILPDGSLFLEGQGVAPTIPVPATPENLLSQDDVVLNTAMQAILTPRGAGVTPSGTPTLHTPGDSRRMVETGLPALEDRAPEQYTQLSQAGQTYQYTVELAKSEPLVWANGWCAADQATLQDNFTHVKLQFNLDGEDLDLDQFAQVDSTADTPVCRLYYSVVDDWPAGEHRLTVQVNFDQAINDGFQDYPAGTHTYLYQVYVEP